MRRAVRVYWAIVVGLAFALAVRGYYRLTRPFLECPDGHCPDPGSREYLGAVESRMETAPQVALAVAAIVLALGLVGHGAWAGFAALRRWRRERDGSLAP